MRLEFRVERAELLDPGADDGAVAAWYSSLYLIASVVNSPLWTLHRCLALDERDAGSRTGCLLTSVTTVREPAPHKLLCFDVHKIDVATFHSARQQHSIRIADIVHKAFLCSLCHKGVS